jgi:hypothetical protein
MEKSGYGVKAKPPTGVRTGARAFPFLSSRRTAGLGLDEAGVLTVLLCVSFGSRTTGDYVVRCSRTTLSYTVTPYLSFLPLTYRTPSLPFITSFHLVTLARHRLLAGDTTSGTNKIAPFPARKDNQLTTLQ